uniref:Uncharacterized protein n=1 Tax=Anguilla anguilla TaxID=7936 RepID=A0A0E9W691_ANGAN
MHLKHAFLTHHYFTYNLLFNCLCTRWVLYLAYECPIFLFIMPCVFYIKTSAYLYL